MTTVSWHIWKYEVDVDDWRELEVFRPASVEDEYQCFLNAAKRLWELQHQKQGEWVGDFAFSTDYFVYILMKGLPSMVNTISRDERTFNIERFNSLTQELK